MEDYGCVREPWLGEFLTLPNGIPSHDTFSRLFRMLDPAGLRKALLCLAQDWADRLGEVVAVDGKALRRSFDRALHSTTCAPAAPANPHRALSRAAGEGTIESHPHWMKWRFASGTWRKPQ